MKVRIFGHLDFYAPGGQLGLKMSDLDPRFTLGDLAQQRDQVLRRLAADGALDANGRLPLSRGADARRCRLQRRHGGLARLPRRARRAAATASSSCSPTPGSRARQAGRRVARAPSRPCRPMPVAREPVAWTPSSSIRGGGARNELAHVRRRADRPGHRRRAGAGAHRTGPRDRPQRRRRGRPHVVKTPTACAQSLVQAVSQYIDGRRASATSRSSSARRSPAGHRRSHVGRAGAPHRPAHPRRRRAGRRAPRRARPATAAPASHRPLTDGERRLPHDRGAPGRPDTAAAHGRGAPPRLLEARVRSLDPVNVLARGWSITRTADGRLVRSAADVADGDALTTQLATGSLRSRVERDESDMP